MNHVPDADHTQDSYILSNFALLEKQESKDQYEPDYEDAYYA